MIAVFTVFPVSLEGGGTFVHHDVAVLTPSDTWITEARVLQQALDTGQVVLDRNDILRRLGRTR
jgi:hypothetical protein